MANRNGSSAAEKPGKPTAEAREALAMWGLALRYAGAAVTPVAKGAAQGVKNSMKERLSAVTSSETSLKDRLNPSTTDKGGKVGDAADAVLEKMGKPGKLAAKASLGSRVVERLTPGTGEETEEPEPAAESEEPVEEPKVQAEPEAEPEEPGEEDAAPEAEAEEAPEDAEDDEPDASTAKSEAPEGTRSVEPHSKPVEPHPGAQPLETDFDHAYSQEVENYEHQDAYANSR